MAWNFLREESGAITTDWVAITSALIIMAIVAIFALFQGGWTPVTNSINRQVGTGSAELCKGDMGNCYEISK